jgi:hypothetical protein
MAGKLVVWDAKKHNTDINYPQTKHFASAQELSEYGSTNLNITISSQGSSPRMNELHKPTESYTKSRPPGTLLSDFLMSKLHQR